MRKKQMKKTPATPNVQAPANPVALLALAVEKNLDPVSLSKLLDVQERWEANEARKPLTYTRI